MLTCSLQEVEMYCYSIFNSPVPSVNEAVAQLQLFCWLTLVQVGFHGRDVDQIVRDLVDNSFTLAKQRLRERKRKQVQEGVEERLLEALVGEGADDATKESMRSLLRNGDLEDRSVEVDTPSRDGRGMFDNSSGAIPMQEFIMRVDRLMGSQRSERKQLKVSEARPMLEDQELERLADSDAVQREALNSAEKDGIVFIDEIDKVCSTKLLKGWLGDSVISFVNSIH